VRKSLLVKRFCAEDVTGLKVNSEAADLYTFRSMWVVGERSIHDNLSRLYTAVKVARKELLERIEVRMPG
jgi:hypothetical protein